jgi:hypothetical protein
LSFFGKEVEGGKEFKRRWSFRLFIICDNFFRVFLAKRVKEERRLKRDGVLGFL